MKHQEPFQRRVVRADSVFCGTDTESTQAKGHRPDNFTQWRVEWHVMVDCADHSWLQQNGAQILRAGVPLIAVSIKALDQVRREEYKRLSGKDRSYIKGQRYTLPSNKENLDMDGRRALKKPLAANSRLNTACLLKEMSG